MSAVQTVILLDFLGNRVGNESVNEMEQLSQHNNSFPHSYLVVNSEHKVHPLSLFKRQGEWVDSSEANHLRKLNDMISDKIDFTMSVADRIKLRRYRYKGVKNSNSAKHEIIQAIVKSKVTPNFDITIKGL